MKLVEQTRFRLRGLLAGLCLIGSLGLASASLSQALFFSLASDIPLPAGMSEVRDTGTAFDKPEGRIVETYAFGRLRPQDVVGFYAEALPALGWARLADNQYARENEKLTLSFSARDGELTLRLDISPR